MDEKVDTTTLLSSVADTVVAGDVVIAEAGYDLTLIAKSLPAGAFLAVVGADDIVVLPVPVTTLPEIEQRPLADVFAADGASGTSVCERLERESAKRLVVLEGETPAETAPVQQCLSDRGIDLVVIHSEARVSSEDFMAEEDSEEVAERLRQLGYL